MDATSLAPINGALIYYEVAGRGDPLVLIHAGVADSRQWNKEFALFQDSFRVLRYDMRGYGRSEPVDAEYSHMQDLSALLDYLHIREPLILMGCSMGGGLAMDFALHEPARVRALVMVDAGPSGLKLDVPEHPLAEQAESAYKEGDLDLLAKLETRIWFDGMGRAPSEPDQSMRKLVYDMDRRGLELDARHLGKRLPDAPSPAADRLSDLAIPVLVIVGEHDTPYILAAADYMVDKIPTSRKVTIADAAHLPNLDHPDAFQRTLSTFLGEVPPSQR